MNEPWTDEDIATLVKHHGKWSTQRIAQVLGRTPLSIYHKTYRMRQSGQLASRHKAHWNEDIDKLLAALDAGVGAGKAAHQMKRSPNAVLERLVERGISAQRVVSRADGMSVADVAAELGVTKWFLHECIDRGWLVANRRKVVKKVVYSVSPHDVFTFIHDHGGYVPLKPNEDWKPYVDAARARFQARYISRTAFAALCFVSIKVPRRWERDEGLPAPALRLHQSYGGDYYDRAAVRAWLAAHRQHQTRAAKEAGLC